MRADEPCVHERDQDPDGPLFRFFFHTGLPCAQCQAEEHAAWVESVRARLTAGLEAAAAGERFDWGAPDPATDMPRFALVRLDDRLDLALTVDADGRCTVPVAGWFTFPRVMTLQEAVDAERWARIKDQLGRGVMTLNQARRTYSPIGFDTSPLFPDGAGEILHAFVNAEPEPGPPYVHTVTGPEQVQDEDGEWYVPIVPTHTLITDPEGCGDG